MVGKITLIKTPAKKIKIVGKAIPITGRGCL
jgi:hypothetical protein